MEYVRITSIDDPNFAAMHRLMQEVFPPEEVLEFSLWAEPLKDEGLRVYAAVHEGQVVGATEYRYYPDMEAAMTDFTIIGRDGLGVGPFLARNRQKELNDWAARSGRRLTGMFAEIYNPYLIGAHEFGGVKAMNPFVRREVLAHLGYRKLDFPYVHPSWQGDGEAVGELDLCFLAYDETLESLPGALVAQFLTTYYAVLPNKPQAWYDMVEAIRGSDRISLTAI
ncbi:GNAT family N-acetyltransferase [Gorillibacterium sp. sgz5001074]|uniref:GNAT family N-acetyltransferase n=1 Tax=Gorillibacterium sp. sgz5001074 TaxID=3446695 RepID=UPI003F67258F